MHQDRKGSGTKDMLRPPIIPIGRVLLAMADALHVVHRAFRRFSPCSFFIAIMVRRVVRVGHSGDIFGRDPRQAGRTGNSLTRKDFSVFQAQPNVIIRQ